MKRRLQLKIFGLVYLIFLTYLLFFAPFRDGTLTGLNLVPFNSYDEFSEMFRPSSILYWLINVPGNVLAFYPLPFILQLFRKRTINWTLAIAFSMLLPSTIEFLQYFFSVGFANIDDVLLNALGIILGTAHLKFIQKKGKLVMRFLPKS